MASLRTSITQTVLRETRRRPYVCPKCELRQMRLSPFNNNFPRRQLRHSSTEITAPPLLTKIKGDLKKAMKEKDAPRLNVLRAMITEYNNASKTSSPIKTDIQLLAVLKKKKAATEAAVAEAKAANRQDLEEKNNQEISVIDEYAGTVDLMSTEALEQAISQVIESIRKAASGDLKAGSILKEIFAPGGALDGKPVDKSQAAKIVNQLLGSK